MEKVIIQSFAEFQEFEGKLIGISPWHKITQEQINQFADATLDHQWIHIDPERSKTGPFGKTIAHGYLTLSLAPYLWEQIADIRNLKMMINYGIENMKFNRPVVVDSEVRLRADLSSIVDLRGVTKAKLRITMEIMDNPKPAYVADLVFLYHFNS